MKRVVVTGMGAITPMGVNVKDFFENIKAGNHGFGIISKFDAWLRKSRDLWQKNIWILRQRKEWSHFRSMQLQRRRKQ